MNADFLHLDQHCTPKDMENAFVDAITVLLGAPTQKMPILQMACYGQKSG
jgi:hypothetical protein